MAVAAALGASTCGATANALQHRTAAHVDGDDGALAAVKATLVHVPWLAAIALQGLGFLLHAVALHFGQLSTVQPMLVCAVLFALPLNRLLRGERITGREVGWAFVLVTGLAGFLVAGTPTVQSPVQPVDVGPAVAFGVTGVVAVAVCAVLSRRSTGAAALGVAAGILFAGQAALLKASIGLAGHGFRSLLGHWQPYTLLVVGCSAIVFTQLAFRRGPLSASLPLVAMVNPVLGVVVGAVVYDESMRDSTLALAAEVAFLAVLTLATLVLSRAELD